MLERLKRINKIRWIGRVPEGLRLYVAFLVGRIPIHQFRLTVYRRVFGVGIGRGTSIHWRTVFFAPEGVTLGRNCIVGNDCFLDGRKGIVIGDNVNIGGHVQIYSLEHDPQDPQFAARGARVAVGDRAWIATRATILPGAVIGEGAVVAAGAVVRGTVAPFTIVGGVPARVIGTRTTELDYELNYHLPFQ